MPALLYKMSSFPKECTARFTAAATWLSLLTSQCIYLEQSVPSSFTSVCPASSFTSAITTLAPCATNRRAVACPMPVAAPVITATLPTSCLPKMMTLSAHLKIKWLTLWKILRLYHSNLSSKKSAHIDDPKSQTQQACVWRGFQYSTTPNWPSLRWPSYPRVSQGAEPYASWHYSKAYGFTSSIVAARLQYFMSIKLRIRSTYLLPCDSHNETK